MSTLQGDIEAYERWLRKRCSVVEADLQAKHARMRRSAFDFLRATCFRWARRIDAYCPGEAAAPRVGSVGDAHVDNFGTWRDAQARLVWGINDFDEAATTPWPIDLVRLATSARLAPGSRLDGTQVAEALLAGYTQGLNQPRPMLVDEHGQWMRPLVADGANAAEKFWSKVHAWPDALPPAPVRRLLRGCLPREAEVVRHAARTAGGGSLGRPRYLVIARWRGGHLVFEAKAAVPSCWSWARSDRPARDRFLELARGAWRAPDPALVLRGGWILRRLAPDAHRIELADVPTEALDTQLFAAMGAEIGAVHAAHRRREAVLDDLRARDPAWLARAAERAEAAVRADFAQLSPPGPAASATGPSSKAPARRRVGAST